MSLSRRQLLKKSAYGALLLSPPNTRQPTDRLFDLKSLEKFVDPLPTLSHAQPRLRNGTEEYRVVMRQFQKKCHRDLPATTMWGYDGLCPGPVIETRSAQSVSVEWVNALPAQHLFPIDHSLHGAEADKPDVRTVTHLHGGRVPANTDGYPENWFTPGHSARYVYPNQQDAALLFYHDHAMAITRLNTAAGLLGLYIIRDDFEDSLQLPAGRYEIPLVLFDRSFRPDGQLFYPVSTKPEAPWVSEYYGGGILANGMLFPCLDVEARAYRFRILNSSNGSFYGLSIGADVWPGGKKEDVHLIGSDQGLLAARELSQHIILGPGERTDILIDFEPFRGRQLYLRTDTGVIMQFRVGSEKTASPFKLPSQLRMVDPLPVTAVQQDRYLTLDDCQDRVGHSRMMLLNGSHWSMPVTENPRLNSVEIWNFVNLTDDSHPIHLHLVRFQILSRQKFDLTTYQLTKKFVFTEAAKPPDPGERGWKDTVRVDPLTITRIIARFEPYAGRYVWHCHMLEHEDNEMMRPYDILP